MRFDPDRDMGLVEFTPETEDDLNDVIVLLREMPDSDSDHAYAQTLANTLERVYGPLDHSQPYQLDDDEARALQAVLEAHGGPRAYVLLEAMNEAEEGPPEE